MEIDIGDKLNLYKMIKNKALEINILEEEVYNDIIIIPKTKKRNIDGIVLNHIKSKFINFQEVIFNYTILDKINNDYRILYYCIYSKALSYLKNFKESIDIKEVKVLHEIILKKLNKNTGKNTYYIICSYRDTYYIYYIHNGIVLSAFNTKDTKEIPDYLDFIKNYINKTYGFTSIDEENNMFYGVIEGKLKFTKLELLEGREALWQHI